MDSLEFATDADERAGGSDLLADFMEEDEACKAAKCSPRTLRRYSHGPDGLPYVKVGRRRLYHVPTFREWLLNRMSRPNPRRVGR